MGKNGGARPGAGRKPKVEEQKARAIINKALAAIYNKDNDEEAQVEFLKKFATTPRGQQFVAEHLFGKATEKVEMNIPIPVIDMNKWK